MAKLREHSRRTEASSKAGRSDPSGHRSPAATTSTGRSIVPKKVLEEPARRGAGVAQAEQGRFRSRRRRSPSRSARGARGGRDTERSRAPPAIAAKVAPGSCRYAVRRARRRSGRRSARRRRGKGVKEDSHGAPGRHGDGRCEGEDVDDDEASRRLPKKRRTGRPHSKRTPAWPWRSCSNRVLNHARRTFVVLARAGQPPRDRTRRRAR
jgi:hypothetical protein